MNEENGNSYPKQQIGVLQEQKVFNQTRRTLHSFVREGAQPVPEELEFCHVNKKFS